MHNCQYVRYIIDIYHLTLNENVTRAHIVKTAWTYRLGFERIRHTQSTVYYRNLIVKRVIPLLLLFVIGGVQAETRYITDQTHITLRAGEGTDHKIQRMLPAGEKVELLSTNPGTGYSKVRDSNGKIGFVLTRQLMESPSARERVADAEEKSNEMKQRLGQVTGKYQELQQKYKQLADKYSGLKSSNANIDSELKEIKEISSDAIRISEERKELRKQLASQTWELENTKQELREMKNAQSQYWFMVGAGVTILGVIIGMILPRMQTRNRKQTW